MIIFSNHFHNYSNEIIHLQIEQYSSRNKHIKLMIKRSCWWYYQLIAVIFSIVSVVISLFYHHFNVQAIAIVLALFSIVSYLFLPVIEESLILFNNLQGIEYERRYLLHSRPVCQFINTNNLVINEAITMQKVIFYLIAIPADIGHLILRSNQPPSKPQTSSNNNNSCIQSQQQPPRSTSDNHQLIPLFTHTLPRLDCLKIVYNYIEEFKNF